MWSNIGCFKLYVRNITMPPKINHYKQKYVLKNKLKAKNKGKQTNINQQKKTEKQPPPTSFFSVSPFFVVAPPHPSKKNTQKHNPSSPKKTSLFQTTLTPTPTFPWGPTTIQNLPTIIKISRWPSWPLIPSSPRVLRMWPFRSRTLLVPWRFGDDGFWERKGGRDVKLEIRRFFAWFWLFLVNFKTRVGGWVGSD